MDLTRDILSAKPGITVQCVVSPYILTGLPSRLRHFFGSLIIKWQKNREIWGLSFTLVDKTVMLGHFRGHHIATHPEICGFTREFANEILRVEVEGVLLHELGHCIYSAYCDCAQIDEKNLARRWAPILQSEGVASDYGAGSVPEGAAEAVRYYLMNTTLFTESAPQQAALIVSELYAANSLL